MLSAAIEGQMRTRLPIWVRMLLLIGALLFLTPDFLQDLAGLLILACVIVWQWFQAKRKLPNDLNQAA